MKPFRRSPDSECGGIFSALGRVTPIETNLYRFVFIAACFLLPEPYSGIPILLYFIAWLVFPRATEAQWDAIPDKNNE